MRVLFLTHRLPYAPNRGDRIRSHHMLRLLAAHADVDLVSLVEDAAEQAHASQLKGLAASVRTVRRDRLRNLARGVAALPSSRPLTHVLLDGRGMQAALAETVAAQRPDVVLAYCSGVARFALEAPLAGIPFVLDMVDVDSAKWRALAKTVGPLRRWIYTREARHLARFEVAAARRAAATLLVNERERAMLARRAPEAAITVVPNGVDLEEFRPLGPPADGARVVFCGMMDYAPNANAMIWFAREVWPRVKARRPDARLTIVGGSPGRAVRRLAQEATIEVTGRVPDVRPFLWRSAVSVAPLWLARGVQNKVLEAVAAGLPTVVTPAVLEGLPPEVTEACVAATTPTLFAQAILELLARPAHERRAIAMRADLPSLAWSTRLNPLLSILDRAASAPVTRRSRRAS